MLAHQNNPPSAGFLLPATQEVAFLHLEILKCERLASMRPACAFPRRALAGPSHMRSVSGEKQRNTSKAAFPAASVMVPGVGSPVLTNQACKARLEYCKRVIAPVLGAHHDHPGKVAGAIWRDCSSRYGNSGIRLGWRQSRTRRFASWRQWSRQMAQQLFINPSAHFFCLTLIGQWNAASSIFLPGLGPISSLPL